VGRVEERCKGAAREIAAKWDRLFDATLYSSHGILSQDGSPGFIIIN
jgi:hypothetical protein